MPEAERLIARFSAKQATVGIVGLGYVGLPLVRAMHGAGHRVVGFDIDESKVRMLRQGQAYLKHLGDELVQTLASSDRFMPTSRPGDLAGCDAIVLCVPTPLGEHREPDLTFVERSTEMVASVLQKGMLVSLESTSYPGTTRKICQTILERGGLRCGRDFFLVFSPEREDPGRKDMETHQIPRLVGGIDDVSTRVGVALYSSAVERVIAVESAEVAESAKLLENIYRAVNIALVNELKPVLTDMGIDIWSVVRAASTKPFGFQPFYPGPGLGGHCIPIDPYYLSWKAREVGHVTRFIELAGEINSSMPRLVVERAARALNDRGKPVKGSRVLVLGIAYKPDIDDIRETPAAEIITLLLERGAVVSYHDPHVARFPSMRNYTLDLAGVPLTAEALAHADCVMIVTNHAAVDYGLVAKHATLIVDTRDAMREYPGPNVVKG
ncbi:MAG: nucleotide sugar dehydrogenase [Phycisphaeraceae bacterium]|nr:nucleotide sugar dehydrogenase [Phycisphaeraceae bacterium]